MSGECLSYIHCSEVGNDGDQGEKSDLNGKNQVRGE